GCPAQGAACIRRAQLSRRVRSRDCRWSPDDSRRPPAVRAPRRAGGRPRGQSYRWRRPGDWARTDESAGSGIAPKPLQHTATEGAPYTLVEIQQIDTLLAALSFIGE